MCKSKLNRLFLSFSSSLQMVAKKNTNSNKCDMDSYFVEQSSLLGVILPWNSQPLNEMVKKSEMVR